MSIGYVFLGVAAILLSVAAIIYYSILVYKLATVVAKKYGDEDKLGVFICVIALAYALPLIVIGLLLL